MIRLQSLNAKRCFWGAVAGAIVAVLLFQSSYLESLELDLLKWRYQVSSRLSGASVGEMPSGDIVIVAFDDASQFDLGVARFDDQHAQGILSRLLAAIERGAPAVVGIDLDLRGAADPGLIASFQRYRNVVLSLFGGLESESDLPAFAFIEHSRACGYHELVREVNGLTCRLPISMHTGGPSGSGPRQIGGWSQLPSFAEAVAEVHRRITGVGPALGAMDTRQPAYIKFNARGYPRISFRDLMSPDFKASCFKGKVVMLGAVLKARADDPTRFRTPFVDRAPAILVHADCVATLLSGQAIESLPGDISRYLLVVLGAIFGGCSSVLPLLRRSMFVLIVALSLVVAAQVLFTGFRLVIPVASPLAVLLVSFVLGTMIFLDTDLNERNRELAEARRSMQARAEEERQRIAEDLHDETLPALSAVARMADRLAKDVQGNSIPGEMREKLDVAVAEMRRVINDLHPSVLETMGFGPALENLLTILAKESGINGRFMNSPDLSDCHLTDFAKLQLYRIVQEALNNVEKHSQADLVELSIQGNSKSLRIAVADNGRGMDPRLTRKDSHGLLNIRQRAQLIGAQVSWTKPVQFTSGVEMSLVLPIGDVDQTGERT